GEGPGIDRLSLELAARPGVETVAPFGAALHVSGTDRKALEAAIAPWRKAPFTWREEAPTLEDVFIHLMGQAEDNFA
ncbi:MAG: ABC transporter ATP-binding protein, partial [Phenylobacterium sp.]